MKLKMRNLIFVISLLLPSISYAGFSILDPTNLNGLLPSNVADAAIKTFGIAFVHRPYDGATSLFQTNSLDFKIEVTMIKIGDALNNALVANGMSTNTTANTIALPIAKIHLRKAFSPNFDAGVSAIYYSGQHAIGTDLKIVLSNPEEGITTAIRLGYSYATAPFLYLKSLSVISPEFVMSRKLSFAEPYLGVGGRYITGTVEVPFKIDPLPAFSLEKAGSGITAYAYTGVNFQILGATGFRLGMEGTYDISGFSSLGTVFGIGF